MVRLDSIHNRYLQAVFLNVEKIGVPSKVPWYFFSPRVYSIVFLSLIFHILLFILITKNKNQKKKFPWFHQIDGCVCGSVTVVPESTF